jgi:phosphatidylglycerophosphatase A
MANMSKKVPFFHPASMISTCFGVGKVPVAPGTFGSLLAFPIYSIMVAVVMFIKDGVYSINSLNVTNYLLLLTAILFIIGIWSVSIYIDIAKADDPKEVVIDEVVGQLLTIILISFALKFVGPESLKVALHGENDYFQLFMISLAGSFVLFRFFDIVKPWPISACEEKFKGAFGVMIDDVVAALLAFVSYYILFYIITDIYPK